MNSWLAIALAGIFFASSFSIHLFWWRFAKPRREVAALFIIFLLGPVFMSTGVLFTGFISIDEVFLVLCLAAALGLFYVMNYPAAQADSPSLQFLRFLQNFPQGISEGEFIQAFDRASLKSDRAADLQREGWLTGNKPRGLGLFIARFFLAIRKLLALRGVG